MSRKVYNTDWATVSGPYSHAVDAGDYVYFSGQTARNSTREGRDAVGIREQTEECFATLFKLLEDAGLTRDQVVKVNVFLTSMDHFSDMNAVYEEQFKAPYPARTTVAVLELPLKADVEIEMVAKRYDLLP